MVNVESIYMFFCRVSGWVELKGVADIYAKRSRFNVVPAKR
jgi:hypothetical protein